MAQLNRGAVSIDKDVPMIPSLAHLRDSDEIAHQADVVMMIYHVKGDFYINVGKNRRGPKTDSGLRVKFLQEFCLFEDAAPYLVEADNY